MKELTKDMVTFTIETEEEDTPVQQALGFKETGADHSEYIQKVIEDDGYNQWLWCSVKITAKYNGLEGTAYLGCCGYESEDDFKKDGYYEQMQDEAFKELKEQVDAIVDEVGVSNTELVEALEWAIQFARDLRYDEQKEKKESILKLIERVKTKK